MYGFGKVSINLGISSFILLVFCLWTVHIPLALVCATILFFSLIMAHVCSLQMSQSKRKQAFAHWLETKDEDPHAYYCILVGTETKGLFSTFFDHRDVDCLFEDIENELQQYFGKPHVRRLQENLFVVIHEFPDAQSLSDEDKTLYQQDLSRKVSERLRILAASYDEKVLPIEDIVVGCATSGIRYRVSSMEDLVDLAFYTWKRAQRDALSHLVADETIRAQKLDIDECKRGFLRVDWARDFNPFYQPIIDPDSFCIVGMESYARWQLDGFRLLTASVFKDLAGAMHRISDIDAIIMEKTFACAHSMRVEGLIQDDFMIVVNISAESVTDEFLNRALRLALHYGLSPECIEFDVDDKILFDPQLCESLRNLRSRGFRIAMDMFDENAFNLNAFFVADFDSLKLDFSSCNSQVLKIFQSLQENASELGLEVLAKGIETAQSMDTAKAVGCNYMQGNYFTPPIPSHVMKTYLRKYRRGLYLGTYEEAPGLA
jgi:EAL domain-containing protein (putative c-di-GMP-specific phosphodiesterase class I)